MAEITGLCHRAGRRWRDGQSTYLARRAGRRPCRCPEPADRAVLSLLTVLSPPRVAGKLRFQTDVTQAETHENGKLFINIYNERANRYICFNRHGRVRTLVSVREPPRAVAGAGRRRAVEAGSSRVGASQQRRRMAGCRNWPPARPLCLLHSLMVFVCRNVCKPPPCD